MQHCFSCDPHAENMILGRMVHAAWLTCMGHPRVCPSTHRLQMLRQAPKYLSATLANVAPFSATPGSLMPTSLTLCGPIVPLNTPAQPSTDHPAWWTITAQQRLLQLRFKDVLPPGKYLLEPAVDQHWATAFATSVPHVQGDPADALRIPYGPLDDIDSVTAGHYPYDASDITVPVFVVYGNDDDVVNDAGAARLLEKLTGSPLRWRLRIDDGTHVMHLEKKPALAIRERERLYPRHGRHGPVNRLCPLARYLLSYQCCLEGSARSAAVLPGKIVGSRKTFCFRSSPFRRKPA